MAYLRCSCCGERCAGRQWWNQDNGFGLCERCVEYSLFQCRSPPDLRRSYGVPGRHWAVPLHSDCKPKDLVGWKDDEGWHRGVLKKLDDHFAWIDETDFYDHRRVIVVVRKDCSHRDVRDAMRLAEQLSLAEVGSWPPD